MVLTVAYAGCVSTPHTKSDVLDRSFAWPCDRLVVTWKPEGAQVEGLVRTRPIVLDDKGKGQLQLSFMRCDPPQTRASGVEPLLFAYVTVPVAAGSVPLVITGVPADGWFELPRIIADKNSVALFAELGYDVLVAEMSFDIRTLNVESTIDVQLRFSSGYFSAVAKTEGYPEPYDTDSALITSSADDLFAFFGHEEAQRYSTSFANIRIEGDTPLSAIDLPNNTVSVSFDRAVRSNRIFWRLPNDPQ